MSGYFEPYEPLLDRQFKIAIREVHINEARKRKGLPMIWTDFKKPGWETPWFKKHGPWWDGKEKEGCQ